MRECSVTQAAVLADSTSVALGSARSFHRLGDGCWRHILTLDLVRVILEVNSSRGITNWVLTVVYLANKAFNAHATALNEKVRFASPITLIEV